MSMLAPLAWVGNSRALADGENWGGGLRDPAPPPLSSQVYRTRGAGLASSKPLPSSTMKSQAFWLLLGMVTSTAERGRGGEWASLQLSSQR